MYSHNHNFPELINWRHAAADLWQVQVFQPSSKCEFADYLNYFPALTGKLGDRLQWLNRCSLQSYYTTTTQETWKQKEQKSAHSLNHFSFIRPWPQRSTTKSPYLHCWQAGEKTHHISTADKQGKKQLQHSYLDIHHPTEHIRYPH